MKISDVMNSSRDEVEQDKVVQDEAVTEQSAEQGLIAKAKSKNPIPPKDQMVAENPTEKPAEVGEEEATPEEQAQYDRVVSMGVMMMSDEKANKMLLYQMKRQQSKPVEALASSAVLLMTRIDDKLKGEISPEILLPAAAEILEQLADFASEAKVIQVDQQVLNDAGVFMMRALMEHFEFTEEDMQGIRDESPEEVKALVKDQQVHDNAESAKQQKQEIQKAEYEERQQNKRF